MHFIVQNEKTQMYAKYKNLEAVLKSVFEIKNSYKNIHSRFEEDDTGIRTQKAIRNVL